MPRSKGQALRGEGEVGGRGSYQLPSSWLNSAEHVQGVELGFHSSMANTAPVWQRFCSWCTQVELTTHVALRSCWFLSSSISSAPQTPFSIAEALSAEPSAPCKWGTLPKHGTEQRTHPLGCLSESNMVRLRGTGDLCDPGMGLFTYPDFSGLLSTPRTKKRTVKFDNAFDFLAQLGSQSAQAASSLLQKNTQLAWPCLHHHTCLAQLEDGCVILKTKFFGMTLECFCLVFCL